MMLDRLLSSIYSALDKSPQKRAVLGLSRDDGIKWQVSGRHLTLMTGAGDFILGLNLQKLTIGELASKLELVGFQVSFVEDEFKGRVAAVLLPADDYTPAGSTHYAYAYDSLLWSILDGYAIELEAASNDVAQIAGALSLSTANDEWLDFWGGYFGIARGGRDDDAYRAYILADVTAERTNPKAIEKAILDAMGRRVEIYEPWRDLFYLNVSRPSDARFYDGATWGPHLIRPVCREPFPINFAPAVAVIQKSRPAGVLMLPPEWRPPPSLIDVDHVTPAVAAFEQRTVYAFYDDKITLSSYEFGTQPTQNYQYLRYNLTAKASLQGIVGVQTGLRVFTTVVKSQIRLSDRECRIGDDDFRFAGYAPVAPAERVVFGAYKLSGGMAE